MAGRWCISWGAYIASHKGFAKKGQEILDELEKMKESKHEGNISE
jgi:hypothetical protein